MRAIKFIKNAVNLKRNWSSSRSIRTSKMRKLCMPSLFNLFPPHNNNWKCFFIRIGKYLKCSCVLRGTKLTKLQSNVINNKLRHIIKNNYSPFSTYHTHTLSLSHRLHIRYCLDIINGRVSSIYSQTINIEIYCNSSPILHSEWV